MFGRPIGGTRPFSTPSINPTPAYRRQNNLTYGAITNIDDQSQREAGTRANMAKFLAAEAAYGAADGAV